MQGHQHRLYLDHRCHLHRSLQREALLASSPAGDLGPVIASVGPWLEGSRRGDHLDQGVTKLADLLMDVPSALHASKEAMARVLGEPAAKLESSTISLADAILHTDHFYKSQLEALVAASSARLLLYLEVSKFDETPMKVAFKEPLMSAHSSRFGELEECAQEGTEAPQQATSTDEHLFLMTTSVAKLFATENRVAMLITLQAHPGGSAAPRPLLLVGSVLSCLQMLDRATGSVMYHALTQNLGEAEVAQRFTMNVRCVTADMAPANTVAEKLIMGSRKGEWAHLYFPCNVHIVARCHSRVFQLMDHDIQGRLHFSLSLGVGSALAKFRTSLAAVLAMPNFVEIIRGSPPVETLRHREFVLNLFCASGGNQALRRYLLERLPNGDWRRRDKVEVCVAPGVEVDVPSLKKQLTTALLLVLAGKNFRVYPKHRWVGCEVATDMVGLAEAVHGLASRDTVSPLPKARPPQDRRPPGERPGLHPQEEKSARQRRKGDTASRSACRRHGPR